VNVGACDCPGGVPKVTTTFCAPGVALAGIVKVASTVPWVASDELVAMSEPSVTLVMGAFAGGNAGGFEPPVESVMLKVMFVPVPRLTLPPGTR
jgi:hypothetical protein